MIEVAEQALEVLLQSIFRSHSLPWQCFLGIHNLSIHNHAHTIGIQKTPLYIDDGFPVPVHDQIGLFRHFSHNDCQQIFLSCCSDKLFHIFWAYHYCHPLLRFRNRDFCTVKSLVFERYLVKVNFQPICQFANSHTNTTSSKVIGFLDETSHIAIAEETLNLALLYSISFLYFRTSRLHRRSCLYLGRASSSTNTITARLASQQDDHITCRWFFTDDVFLRSRTDNRTQLHPLSNKAWMEILTDIGRC